MRLIKKHINFKEKIFHIKVQCEEHSDDIWNLYHLLDRDDFIVGWVQRKIAVTGMTGKQSQEKKAMRVMIKVTGFDYQTDNDNLRINGVNARESKWIGVGQHQAMDITAPQSLELIKRVFDSEHVRRLHDATSEAQQGQILAIVMEEGLAQVYLVSNGNCR